MSEETSDESIETKPEAVKAINRKVGKFVFMDNSRKLELRKQISGVEYNKDKILYMRPCKISCTYDCHLKLILEYH